MDDEDSDDESIEVLEALPPCESTTGKALRRGLGAMKAAGVGMGFRKKGTLRKFSLDEDMLIIAHMIEVARYKFGRTALGNWPSIVDCVAAHPEVLSRHWRNYCCTILFALSSATIDWLD